MSDWGYAQSHPREKLARLHHFSVTKVQDGAEIEMIVTVKEYFTPPLGAGTYTFLIQQTGATTAYQFDFGVTSVPEPGSLCLVGLAATMALRRRTGR